MTASVFRHQRHCIRSDLRSSAHLSKWEHAYIETNCFARSCFGVILYLVHLKPSSCCNILRILLVSFFCVSLKQLIQVIDESAFVQQQKNSAQSAPHIEHSEPQDHGARTSSMLASPASPDSSPSATSQNQVQTPYAPIVSPESLQTVVTYAASFTTKQERMDFALQVYSPIDLMFLLLGLSNHRNSSEG